MNRGRRQEDIFPKRSGKSGEDLANYLVRLLTRETLTEVGKHFGIDRYSTVSSVVARVKIRLKNDGVHRTTWKKFRKDCKKDKGDPLLLPAWK